MRRPNHVYDHCPEREKLVDETGNEDREKRQQRFIYRLGTIRFLAVFNVVLLGISIAINTSNLFPITCRNDEKSAIQKTSYYCKALPFIKGIKKIG